MPCPHSWASSGQNAVYIQRLLPADRNRPSPAAPHEALGPARPDRREAVPRVSKQPRETRREAGVDGGVRSRSAWTRPIPASTSVRPLSLRTPVWLCEGVPTAMDWDTPHYTPTSVFFLAAPGPAPALTQTLVSLGRRQWEHARKRLTVALNPEPRGRRQSPQLAPHRPQALARPVPQPASAGSRAASSRV